MKKTLAIILALTLFLCVFTACRKTDNGDTDTKKGGVEQYVAMAVSEHVDSDDLTLNIEIPNLLPDTEAAKSINDEINMLFYGDDIQTAINGGFSGIEIYITPKTALYDTIVSIRIDESFVPMYGTDGSVYIVNYDTATDSRIELDQMFTMFGYTYWGAMDAANILAAETYGAEFVDSVEAQGLFVNEDGSCELICYVMARPNGVDTWQYVLSVPLPKNE
ncbi:MAG: hypothetical protein IJG50_03765 [Clostridia bacterium]|nr:hypothetical protein [Clostridia bacterium]